MGDDRASKRGGSTPLFVDADSHADALIAAVEAAGWRTVRERRAGHAVSTLVASGAKVALFDARSGFNQGVDAVRSLQNLVAPVAIVAAADLERLAEILDAGAVQYLVEPFSDIELVQSLGLARRHADRPGAVAPSIAGRDALTGLGNAAAARRWLDARMAGEREVNLLALAITRFEMINTAFGRETGDDILARIATMIVPLVDDLGGPQALLARTAGAEFLIGIEGHVSPERLRLLAEQIVDCVERPLTSGGRAVTLSSRIVVMPAVSDVDAGRLLRRATSLLAETETAQSSPVRMISAATPESERDEQALRTDLRAALDRGEIEMLFQPQVSITTGEITGVEALARWRHARLGDLGAATLFVAAEQSDYVVPLSAHIQQTTLAIASAWPESLSRLRLAINITASDIARAGFAESFLALVDASGFDRHRLTVEITESGLIEDLGAAADLLARLRAGGCRVAIDDFGTGYSSLAYLKSLPLDYLKIDSRLAQDIAGSPRDRIVVRGVIDMARALGLAVVAEGVETEEQLQLLAREGCNYYQGFLCAGAMDSIALAALVKDRITSASAVR